MRLTLSRTIRDVPLTSGDWLVLSALGIVLAVGIVWAAAELSYSFTSEVPAKGGAYQEALIGTPRFVNPVLAISDADRDLVALMFSGLMRARPDGTLEPDLASGYTLSEDGRTYTFTLRDDVRFHNDMPVTAEDVAFTVSLAKNPILKSAKRANWEGIEVAVIDEHTVSFTLKEPYALFLENTRLGILPKYLWGEVAVEEMPFSTLNVEPVGTGPYRLDKLVTTAAGIPTEIRLTAFSGGGREPYIEHITLKFYPDAEALGAALQGDPSLGAHSLPPALFPRHALKEAVMGRVFSVFFNHNQNELFADIVVRRALDASLDKKELVSTLIGGYGSPVSEPLPPASIEQETAVRTDDPLAKAAEILERNGWERGEDGIYEKTEKKITKRLSFSLVTGTAPELRAAGEYVADTWRELGADVSLAFFEASDLQQQVIRPRKYDALLFGEVVGRGADLFAFWDSSQRNDPGLNIAQYTNTSVDKLLRDARTNPNEEARQVDIEEAAATIAEEVAAVFLYSPHFIYLVPEKLSGIHLGTVVTPSDRFLTVHEWYLVTERVWPFLSRNYINN